MIFSYITKCKNRSLFDLVLYIVIFTFILTLGGCYTTYENKVSPETVKYMVEYKILQAVKKDGLVINLRDKEAKYTKKYLEHENVIVYSTVDTIRVGPNAIKKKYEIHFLDINDLISLTVEKKEFNAGVTVLATIGIIAALAALIFVIAPATKESCPFIYSFNGEKFIFDSEPYGGAVTEGLKKTDYSRLEHLAPTNGKYRLMMRNEADETQHTDEIKLLLIDHPENTEIAPDMNGKMTVFSEILNPYSVTDEKGTDITSFFRSRDNVQWQTDLPKDSSFIGKNLKHELILKFPKPAGAKRVKLIINAGTALWGGYMIKEMLNLRGDKVDNWYENINNNGTELSKLYQFMEREELYALKVYVFENENWVLKNYFPAGGPFLDEDKIVDLNIENVAGDTLAIRLNPPYGYWKMDFAGAIYDYTQASQVDELSLSFAQDQDGTDLRETLSLVDAVYYDMQDTTCSADLYFNVPSGPIDGYTRSLYLKTTGYYDIHLTKDQPEQTELIEKIYNTPGLILEYTIKLYMEKIRSLGMID